MNLQLLTGQQNAAARNEASKIVVRNGGSLKRRHPYGSLWGGNNIPFRVTDGGGVLPLGQTPEGYDLYEIIGNDHEHYHKTRSGKQKSGVGFRFATGEEIEGEGNQYARKGELLLVTPNDAKFISKHSINGFNPTDAVFAGMHPVEAFNIQEEIKAENGITNNGRKQKRRKLRTIGGIASSPYNIPDVAITPEFSSNTVSPTATGVAYIMQRNSESNPNNMNYGSSSKYNVAKYGKSLRKKAGNGAYYWGAGLNTLGNVGGALITSLGNNRAANILSSANNKAAELLARAYGNMRTIDTSLVKREDFAAPHAMAAIQAPIVNTNTQRTLTNRSLLRRQEAINRGSLSAAASQNRLANAEVDYNDIISQIENQADKERQAIIQGNMERITQVANENANRDAQANREWLGNYLNLLQYNNDIENQKIMGAAGAYSDALTQNAGISANAITQNAQSWGNAVSNSTNSFANALTTVADNKARLKMIEMTTDPDVLKRNQINWAEDKLINGTRAERKKAVAILNRLTVE